MRLAVSRPNFPPWAQGAVLCLLLTVLAALLAPMLVPYLPPPGTLKTLVSDGDERDYYLFVPPELPASQPVPIVFMLQGFDSAASPSGATRELYWQIAVAARMHRFIAVFPRGMQGSFPDVPVVRAWCPEFFHKNRNFLVGLVEAIGREYPLDKHRIILAGFSNGAYFASTELTARRDSPFTAFWLDGGGYPYAFDPAVKRRPTFLTWGDLDIHNASHAHTLSEFLSANGWRENETLVSERHPWAHVFNADAVGRAIAFLLDQ